MTRGWWVVFGALGGLCLFGGAALFLRVWDPEPWNLVAYFLALPVGLVVGGLLGSRAHRMARPMRIGFGAVVGASFLALVGGSAFLFLGGSGGGLARFQGKNFAIGAIVGGVAGLFVGGMLGAKTAGQEDRGFGDID